DAGARDASHATHAHSSMPRNASANHRLMIRACDEVRTETARVHLFELEFGLAVHGYTGAGASLIHSLAIRRCGQRHVVRVLVSPVDFQRGHTELDDFRNLPQRVEIPG